jgi:hypothetical protein
VHSVLQSAAKQVSTAVAGPLPSAVIGHACMQVGLLQAATHARIVVQAGSATQTFICGPHFVYRHLSHALSGLKPGHSGEQDVAAQLTSSAAFEMPAPCAVKHFC